MRGPKGERSRRAAARTPDAGAAVVDVVLVGVLLSLLLLAVLQLTLAVHVRTTLVDCAGEGARFAALAGNDPAAGEGRTRELIGADLSETYAQDVVAGREVVEGLDTVVVRVRAPLPVLGLLGVGTVVQVEGHARAEAP